MRIGFLLLSCLLTSIVACQQSASALLDKSIAFHDPHNNWNKFEGMLSFSVERPDKPDGKRKVFIDNEGQSFSFWAQYDDGLLQYNVDSDRGAAKWNGKKEISEAMVEKYRISADRAVMYRDYYTYLYGMPMKLKDLGTIIDPEVKEVEFYGKTYNRIRVTYDDSVGDDIWYFYFSPTTHAMEAYQFFHDESKNDGEYILFEEIVEIDKVKIPRIRKWYYNSDNKFLATDVLIN